MYYITGFSQSMPRMPLALQKTPISSYSYATRLIDTGMNPQFLGYKAFLHFGSFAERVLGPSLWITALPSVFRSCWPFGTWDTSIAAPHEDVKSWTVVWACWLPLLLSCRNSPYPMKSLGCLMWPLNSYQLEVDKASNIFFKSDARFLQFNVSSWCTSGCSLLWGHFHDLHSYARCRFCTLDSGQQVVPGRRTMGH